MNPSALDHLLPTPSFAEEGFPLSKVQSPIFSPLITADDYNEGEDEEPKQMRRYPDPLYDRRVDLISAFIPCPTPNEVLQCYYGDKEKNTVMRRYFRSATGISQNSRTLSNSKDVKENSFVDWPLNVRQNVYKYLLPDEARKITLSEKISTREVFEEGYFATLVEIREPIEGAMGACKTMYMDLNILFWAKYEFHITLDPFTYADKKGLRFLLWNMRHVQRLTIELDYTRYAMSKSPGSWLLKHDLSRYISCIRELVSGFLKRDRPIPFLFFLCRRFAGNREVEDTGGDPCLYCPKENFRVIHPFGELNKGKISMLRMAGFSKQYTIEIMKLIFEGDPVLTTPDDAPWPPVPSLALLRNKITPINVSTPEGEDSKPSTATNPPSSLSLPPDLPGWEITIDDWCQDAKIADDSCGMVNNLDDEESLKNPRGRTEHRPLRIPIEDLIAASRGPSPARSQHSLAKMMTDSQDHVGLIPALNLLVKGPENGIFYGTLELPSKHRLQKAKELMSTSHSLDSALCTQENDKSGSSKGNAKFRTSVSFDRTSDPDQVCKNKTNNEGGDDIKDTAVDEPDERGLDSSNNTEDAENVSDRDDDNNEGNEGKESEGEYVSVLDCSNAQMKEYKFPFLATALQDFPGQNEGELGFVKGEVVIVTCFVITNKPWQFGRCGKRQGFFPKYWVHEEKVLSYAIAIFDYTYEYVGMGCNFTVDDRIAVMGVHKDPAYIRGFNTRTFQHGMFQRNYVNEGNADINLTAPRGMSLWRAVVKDARAGASEDGIFSNRFRTGDQISVLQCIDDSKGLYFGKNCRTNIFGRFSKKSVHRLPAIPSILCRAIAIDNYKGEPYSKLSLIKGDKLVIIDHITLELWYGKSLRTAQTGFVLAKSLRVVQETGESLSTTASPFDITKIHPGTPVGDIPTTPAVNPRPSSDDFTPTNHDDEKMKNDAESIATSQIQNVDTIGDPETGILNSSEDNSSNISYIHRPLPVPGNHLGTSDDPQIGMLDSLDDSGSDISYTNRPLPVPKNNLGTSSDREISKFDSLGDNDSNNSYAHRPLPVPRNNLGISLGKEPSILRRDFENISIEDDEHYGPKDQELNPATEKLIAEGYGLRLGNPVDAFSRNHSSKIATPTLKFLASGPETLETEATSKIVIQNISANSNHPATRDGAHVRTRNDSLLVPAGCPTLSRSFSLRQSMISPNKMSWRSKSIRKPHATLDTSKSVHGEDPTFVHRPNVLTKSMPPRSQPTPKTPRKVQPTSRQSTPGWHSETHRPLDDNRRASLRGLKSKMLGNKEAMEERHQPNLPSGKVKSCSMPKAPIQDKVKGQPTLTSGLLVMSKTRVASTPRTSIAYATCDGNALEVNYGSQSSSDQAGVGLPDSSPLSQSRKGSGLPATKYLSPDHQHRRPLPSPPTRPFRRNGSPLSIATTSRDVSDTYKPSADLKKLRTPQGLSSSKAGNMALSRVRGQDIGARSFTPPRMHSPAENRRASSVNPMSKGEGLVAFLNSPGVARATSMSSRRRRSEIHLVERALASMSEDQEEENTRGSNNGRGGHSRIPASKQFSQARGYLNSIDKPAPPASLSRRGYPSFMKDQTPRTPLNSPTNLGRQRGAKGKVGEQ